MIKPLFTYCSIVTCHNSSSNDLKIRSLEDRARRIIFKGKPATTNLPSTNDLMKKKICEFVFNCLKNEIGEDFGNYFELMGNITRNKGILIRIPVTKLECTKKSLYFSGASIFNSLPLYHRKASTLSEFLSYF